MRHDQFSKSRLLLFSLVFQVITGFTQNINNGPESGYMLRPNKVFDGEEIHSGWAVIVQKNIITAVGPENMIKPPKSVIIIDLPKTSLMPGMIEGHSHILLHPYNETNWNDQVLVESEAERVVRATVHVKNSLMAGITTMRDLGSEGAGYADVGVKTAIEKGVIPGPRLLVAGKAIVATGSYGPKGFNPRFKGPLGAEATDGNNIIRVVRDQIGHGADFIKVYADYRWGPESEAMPTFSLEELKLMVATAKSSGRYVVAHAATAEGMRRAVLAGVETIEHGDGGTEEVFKLMKTKNVALCPTIAAGQAIMQYRGWKVGEKPEPERIINKKISVALALKNKVTICAGGDVGVFSHGDNVRELELMQEYGMSTIEVLKACTSGNAAIMHLDHQLGAIRSGMLADVIAVNGNPEKNISDLRKVIFVMKDGVIYKQP